MVEIGRDFDAGIGEVGIARSVLAATAVHDPLGEPAPHLPEPVPD